ncbi:hypothetical protein RJ639_010714 [Escallonia herrerae]|uniref:peptidylprolyl isomerase n=1 Tax=Escallonia herrerae TaxID=1293975 RepID=A0AA88VR06_9ASTE|nr:hypothetical protein RJ639_010714 [Escallonia herrerae]
MYYQVPGLDFRPGLRLITDDYGVMSMLEYYKSTDMVPLYVERVDPLQVVGSDGNVIVRDKLLIENNNGDQDEMKVGDGDVTQAHDTGGGSGKDVKAVTEAIEAAYAETSAEVAEAEAHEASAKAAKADLPELSEGIERGPQDDDIVKEGVEKHVHTVNVNVGEGQWYSDGDNEDELRTSGSEESATPTDSMELSLLLHQPLKPSLLLQSLQEGCFLSKWRKPTKRSTSILPCYCSSSSSEATTKPAAPSLPMEGRRALMASLLAAAVGIPNCDVAGAVSTSRRALKGAKVPESEYTTLPNGLKYYDLKVGSGLKAVKGARVARIMEHLVPDFGQRFGLNGVELMLKVHYVAKWKNITFMTSRQGLGVGGGTPYGFDVGDSERGVVLKGLDLGVEGMRVGGQRLVIVPPELAYGSKGVQEIPPNATIEVLLV